MGDIQVIVAVLVILILVVMALWAVHRHCKRVSFGPNEELSFCNSEPPNAVGKKKVNLMWMKVNAPMTYRRLVSKNVPDYDYEIEKHQLGLSPDIHDEIEGRVALKHKPFVDLQECDHIDPTGFTS